MRDTEVLLKLLDLGMKDVEAGRTRLPQDVIAELRAEEGDPCPDCTSSSSTAAAICNRCSNGGY